MRTAIPLPCAFRGVPLNVRSVRDETGRDWVERSLLGRDGVVLEDAGRRPTRFNVEVFFAGATWRRELLTLRQAVENAHTSAAVFNHPYWGELVGEAMRLEVTHTDQKHDYAEARFDFVEADIVGVTFSSTATLATAAAAATAALDQADAALAALAAT